MAEVRVIVARIKTVPTHSLEIKIGFSKLNVPIQDENMFQIVDLFQWTQKQGM